MITKHILLQRVKEYKNNSLRIYILKETVLNIFSSYVTTFHRKNVSRIILFIIIYY